MDIKKSELKNFIKECIKEVIEENAQHQPYDFDADWKRMDEQGVPVTHLNEENYKSFVSSINEANSYSSAENVLKQILKG